MMIGVTGLSPPPVGKRAGFLKPSMIAVPEMTFPNTECLSSSSGVLRSVMKNCDPPVLGKFDFAIEST